MNWWWWSLVVVVSTVRGQTPTPTRSVPGAFAQAPRFPFPPQALIDPRLQRTTRQDQQQQLLAARQQRTPQQEQFRQRQFQEELQRQFQQQLLQRQQLLKQLDLDFPTSTTGNAISSTPRTTNQSPPVFVSSTSGLQLLQIPIKNLQAAGSNLSPSQLVTKPPSSPSTTPATLLDQLTHGVVPPGADIEVIRPSADGGLEVNHQGLPPNLPKQVTFVILEEQPDGSYKVQGVRGSNNEPPPTNEVDNIIKKLQEGKIKLPPPSSTKPPRDTPLQRYSTTNSITPSAASTVPHSLFPSTTPKPTVFPTQYTPTKSSAFSNNIPPSFSPPQFIRPQFSTARPPTQFPPSTRPTPPTFSSQPPKAQPSPTNLFQDPNPSQKPQFQQPQTPTRSTPQNTFLNPQSQQESQRNPQFPTQNFFPSSTPNPVTQTPQFPQQTNNPQFASPSPPQIQNQFLHQPNANQNLFPSPSPQSPNRFPQSPSVSPSQNFPTNLPTSPSFPQNHRPAPQFPTAGDNTLGNQFPLTPTQNTETRFPSANQINGNHFPTSPSQVQSNQQLTSPSQNNDRFPTSANQIAGNQFPTSPSQPQQNPFQSTQPQRLPNQSPTSPGQNFGNHLPTGPNQTPQFPSTNQNPSPQPQLGNTGNQFPPNQFPTPTSSSAAPRRPISSIPKYSQPDPTFSSPNQRDSTDFTGQREQGSPSRAPTTKAFPQFQRPRPTFSAQDGFANKPTTPVEDKNSLTSILRSEGLNSMAKYLEQSGLDKILNDTGPYTVFAPTDEAFEQLMKMLGGAERANQKFRANPRLLSGLLLHHVIPGAFPIGTLQNEMTGVSLAGTQLRVNLYEREEQPWKDIVTINGAEIQKSDIIIPQGIAHGMDKVLFPLPVGNLIQTLQSDRGHRFTKFIRAVRRAGLADRLSGSKTYTVFAPTNRAFSEFTDQQLERLLNNREQLQSMVLKHVLPGSLFSSGMKYYQIKDSMGGEKLRLFRSKDQVKVNSASVVSSNIPATNGVIHVLDSLA